MLKMGGLDYFEKQAKLKTGKIYDLIDNSNGFCSNHVEGSYRSRLNVVFRISGGDANLENKFIAEAR